MHCFANAKWLYAKRLVCHVSNGPQSSDTNNRKPTHPIPAFVTKFSSFGCFFAKHDRYHCRPRSRPPRGPRSVRRRSSSSVVRFRRESAGFSSLSRSILSLALLSGRGKRDFPVSFCSFLSYGCDLAASGSISQLLLLLQRQRQNTNKRAVIFLLWILIIFSFGSDLI